MKGDAGRYAGDAGERLEVAAEGERREGVVAAHAARDHDRLYRARARVRVRVRVGVRVWEWGWS